MQCNDAKRCYAQLVKATLPMIILFNRRSRGESRLTVLVYEKVSGDHLVNIAEYHNVHVFHL